MLHPSFSLPFVWALDGAGSGHDLPIGFIENVHIRGRDLRCIRVEPGVEILQPLVHVDEHVGHAVFHAVVVGRNRLKRDGAFIELQKLLDVEHHVACRQVRGDFLLIDVNEFVEVGDVVQLQKLAHHGLEHLVLHVDAADVAVGIRVAEAEHAHGLIAIEVLIALLHVDAQVLTGIVIVHINRDVEVDTAHGVNEFDEHLHVKERITVDPVAENLLRTADERLHAVLAVVLGRGVILVHLFGPVGHIHSCVTRDADKFQRLILRVEHTDEHRVRQAGRAVLARDKERVAPLLAAVGTDIHTVVRIAVAQAAGQTRRADPVVHQDRKLADQQRQHHDHNDRDAHFLLFLPLSLRSCPLTAKAHLLTAAVC